jgi:hypothetical protein
VVCLAPRRELRVEDRRGLPWAVMVVAQAAAEGVRAHYEQAVARAEEVG